MSRTLIHFGFTAKLVPNLILKLVAKKCYLIATQTLTCNYPTDAFPCEEAESLYGAVEFGKVDDYDA